MPQISMEIPYQIGMTYGRGIDSLTGRVRGFGVLRGEPEEIRHAPGQIIRYYLHKVESTADLEKALGLHSEVNAQFGLFGASAKFDFAQANAFHGYSVFLVTRMEVHNAFRQVVDVRLDPALSGLLKDGHTDRFRARCGDAYVAGLQTGGEFCAVLRLETRDATDQRELSGKLSGSYTFSGGSAQFSDTMRAVTKDRFLHVTMYQAGGTDTATTNSIDEVLGRVLNYADAVKDEPVPYSALILDYETLDLPEGPTLVEIEDARIALLQFARQRATLLALQNQIDYIREHPEQFNSPDLPALNGHAADIANRLNLLKDKADAASRSVTHAQFFDVGIPVVNLPQRREGAPAVIPPQEFVTVPNLIGASYNDIYPYPNNVPREPFASLHSNFGVIWIRGIPVDDFRMYTVYEQRPEPDRSVPKGSELVLTGYDEILR